MEIITGIERRRRWSTAEKLRIVSEMERPSSSVAEISRRYEISRGLLWNWRSQVRRGVLRPEPPAVFVPVQVAHEPLPTEQRQGAEPPPCTRADSVADGKIEITLADGTRIKVGHDVSLVTLRRVISALRG